MDPEYSRTERFMGWLAVAFAAGLLLLSLDVALGGRILGRPGYPDGSTPEEVPG